MHQRSANMTSLLGGVLLLLVVVSLQSHSSLPPVGVVDAFIPASSRTITVPSASKLVKSTKINKRSSSLSYTSSLPPEVHESTLSFLQTDQVLQKKRQKLKRRLLDAADEYKIRRQIDDLFQEQMAAGNEKNVNKASSNQQKDGYSVTRLLKRIFSKIVGNTNRRNKKKNKSVLSSDKFRQKTLDIGDDGRAILDLAEELIKLNPTPNPTYGFRGYDGGHPADCKLNGKWKLRFTTAADASFDKNDKRGKISTSQDIDCEGGTLTNVVDFEQGKLEGFRVVVEGTPVSDNEIDLSFIKVNILRKSRFPKLFGRLSFRLPSQLLRRLNKDKDKRGPYLTIKYLGDDLRIHQSGSGNWFIQSRVR